MFTGKKILFIKVEVFALNMQSCFKILLQNVGVFGLIATIWTKYSIFSLVVCRIFSIQPKLLFGASLIMNKFLKGKARPFFDTIKS